MNQWKPIINIQIELHSVDGGKFQQQSAYWEGLANSFSQLPPDAEELINTNQERTLITIQNDGSSSTGGYDYASGYEDYSYEGNLGSSSSSLASNYTVTALYDYQGQQPEDLSFRAGDVIKVISDDDGSGWMEGELRGKKGIFPTSYVQYN